LSTPIEILFEDSELLIVNKPPFMMVHPWKGGPRGEIDLMNALKEQTGHYLYPVHRLDRQTSGVVLFALESKVVTFFKDRWHSDEVQKKYLCLASGALPVAGYYDNSLRNKKGIKQPCYTSFVPLGYFDHPQFPATLCDVTIKTGRKHQIRRHFSRHMKNLVGDTRYGKGKINDFFREFYALERLFLHAHYLKLPHPSRNELIEVRAPLSPDLDLLGEKLFKENWSEIRAIAAKPKIG
jgi:23S rRNA-/tRNA-specific pseudouridylate synthase